MSIPERGWVWVVGGVFEGVAIFVGGRGAGNASLIRSGDLYCNWMGQWLFNRVLNQTCAAKGKE